MKIKEVGGCDDYMEFNVSDNGSNAWVEVHNPWTGDTNSGFGASAQLNLTKDQARTLAAALMAFADA